MEETKNRRRASDAPSRFCLIDAIRSGDRLTFNTITSRLIFDRHYIDINEATPCGNTALHYAMQHLKYHNVELLLLLGANPNAENEDSEKPIDMAATLRTSTQFVKWMSYGVDVATEELFNDYHMVTLREVAKENEEAILQDCVRSDRGEGMKTLLRLRQYETERLFTIFLDHCVRHRANRCAVEVAKWLKKKRNAKDNMYHVLHYAVMNHCDFVEELLKMGMDANVTNAFGETPLHYAMLSNLRSSKTLLFYGANPHHPCRFGTSPVQVAPRAMREWYYGQYSGTDYVLCIDVHDTKLLRATSLRNIPNPYGLFVLAIMRRCDAVLQWFMHHFRHNNTTSDWTPQFRDNVLPFLDFYPAIQKQLSEYKFNDK